MDEVDHSRVSLLMQDGAHGEALALLQQAFAQAECDVVTSRSGVFITRFQWTQLAKEYAPARAALRQLRDRQIARFFAGEEYVGLPDDQAHHAGGWTRRFSLIVTINADLDEQLSTCEVFLRLHHDDPARARRYASAALPALVAAGQFALADHYRGEPLEMLALVNDHARTLPLMPVPFRAPRLAAELMSLVGDVRIGSAVLCGLGRDEEATALREALLSGLESDEVRALARRELAEPGTISSEIAQHQMALEAAADDRQPAS